MQHILYRLLPTALHQHYFLQSPAVWINKPIKECSFKVIRSDLLLFLLKATKLCNQNWKTNYRLELPIKRFWPSYTYSWEQMLIQSLLDRFYNQLFIFDSQKCQMSNGVQSFFHAYVYLHLIIVVWFIRDELYNSFFLNL